jgi:hypothetical protein
MATATTQCENITANRTRLTSNDHPWAQKKLVWEEALKSRDVRLHVIEVELIRERPVRFQKMERDLSALKLEPKGVEITLLPLLKAVKKAPLGLRDLLQAPGSFRELLVVRAYGLTLNIHQYAAQDMIWHSGGELVSSRCEPRTCQAQLAYEWVRNESHSYSLVLKRCFTVVSKLAAGPSYLILTDSSSERAT